LKMRLFNRKTHAKYGLAGFNRSRSEPSSGCFLVLYAKIANPTETEKMRLKTIKSEEEVKCSLSGPAQVDGNERVSLLGSGTFASLCSLLTVGRALHDLLLQYAVQSFGIRRYVVSEESLTRAGGAALTSR
jgi:hypothetical protein